MRLEEKTPVCVKACMHQHGVYYSSALVPVLSNATICFLLIEGCCCKNVVPPLHLLTVWLSVIKCLQLHEILDYAKKFIDNKIIVLIKLIKLCLSIHSSQT